MSPAELWQKLSSGRRLVVPGSVNGGATRFVAGAWSGPVYIPGAGTTEFSLKEHFFPQSDYILEYQRDDGVTVTETPPRPEPTVIWGVRPCDARALAVLDRAFADPAAPLDSYVARRDSALVVAFGCPSMCDGGFCERMGVDRTVAAGADLTFVPDGDGWKLLALTEKGAMAAGVDAPNGDTAAPAMAAPSFAGKEKEFFKHPVWDELAETCISCQACTFVCPTCHCFTIVDEHLKNDGVRAVVWDSCAAPGFTKMAGGHNPRAAVTARVRQRLLHKFAYFPQRYGVTACSGCGRCAAVCPMDRRIDEMVARLEEVIGGGN